MIPTEWASRIQNKYRRIQYQAQGKPGSRYLSLEEWNPHSPNSHWWPSHAALPVEVFPSEEVSKLPNSFFDPIPNKIPSTGVLRLSGGKIQDRAGWILTADNEWLYEFSRYQRSEVAKRRFRLPFPKPIFLRGRCLSLASDWSDENLFHFLYDSLGKLPVLESRGFDYLQFDYICLPRPLLPQHGLFLKLLKIPESKIIWTAPDKLYQADELYAVPCQGVSGFPAPWVARDLQQRFGVPHTSQRRRIYLSRKGHRRAIANEQSLLPILNQYGFEIIDPAEIADPRGIFHETEAIVGAHGAGLTYVTFCQPGTSLLELFSDEYARPTFFALAGHLNLRYFCEVGVAVQRRASNDTRKSTSDFIITPEALSGALNRMFRF